MAEDKNPVVDSNIIEELRKLDKVTIGFSCGKDSLACALILKELDIPFIPFYFYHVPDISFVNEQIKHYEQKLEIEIVQLPHPMLYDCLRHQDYQPYSSAVFMAEQDWPKMTFEDLIYSHLDDIGHKTDMYDIVGMRSSESFNRRKFFEKNGPILHEKKKIYPIHNWNNADVRNYIKSKGVELTQDYDIWNRSWDGLKYQFIMGVKERHPEDYEKIKEYFPLIELESLRYKWNHEHLG